MAYSRQCGLSVGIVARALYDAFRENESIGVFLVPTNSYSLKLSDSIFDRFGLLVVNKHVYCSAHTFVFDNGSQIKFSTNLESVRGIRIDHLYQVDFSKNADLQKIEMKAGFPKVSFAVRTKEWIPS